MLKRSLVAAVIIFLLPACGSTPNNDIQKEPEKPLTTQDVMEMYGEPNFKVSENGITAYAYRYDVNRVNLLNYIPFIKELSSSRERSENYLYAVFDKNGNLIEFNSDGIVANSPQK